MDDDICVTPQNVGRFSTMYSSSPEGTAIPPLPPHLQIAEDIITAAPMERPLLIDPASPREWEGKGTARIPYERTPESFAYAGPTTPDRPTQQEVSITSVRYKPTIGHIGRQLFEGADASFAEPTRKEVRSGYALFRRPKSEIPTPGSAQSGITKL